MMFAELRRHIWLECTPVRLLLCPVVLALLFLAVYYGGGFDSPQSFNVFLLTAFFAFAGAWGSHLVAASIAGEAAAQTLDWQRLSSQTPFELVVGKLLGAPVLAWYGGFYCLALYLYLGLGINAPHTLLVAAIAVVGTVALHALFLLLELMALPEVRPNQAVRRRMQIGWLVFAMCLLLSLILDGRAVRGTALSSIRWFGAEWDVRVFVLLSLASLAAWTVWACRQRTAALLREPTTPLSWIAFLAWCGAYTAGFASDPGLLLYLAPRVYESHGALLPALTLLLLSAALAFLEDKSAVTWRLWLVAMSQGDRRRAWQRMPRWLAGLPLVLAAQGYAWWLLLPSQPAGVWWLSTLGLCLIRDLAVQRGLHWNGGKGRPVLAFPVYLLTVYVLLPRLSGWLAGSLFLDLPLGRGWIAIVEAAAAIAFCAWRWRRHYAVSGRPPAA